MTFYRDIKLPAFHFLWVMALFFLGLTLEITAVTPVRADIGLTVEVTEAQPMDIVSGTVSGAANFDQLRVVVFVRTDKWYPQPNPSGFFLNIGPDGGYETVTHPWKQVAAFVIDQNFDAWNGYNLYDSFPLEVDGSDVLAIGVYPSIKFAGYEWAVKGGDRLQPPGPSPGGCDYHAGEQSVWVDKQRRLHLKMARFDTDWRCAEVYLPPLLGFGHYHFLIDSRVDQLDKNLVASPFLYYNTQQELDIEFSSWQDPAAENAQFVVQPYNLPDHRHRFHMTLNDEKSTHIITWNPGEAVFTSAQGHHGVISENQTIETWRSTSPDVADQEYLRVHMNLWMIDSLGPSDELPAEMIIKDFAFYKKACNCPETGDWMVSESCTLTTDLFPMGDVIVAPSAELNFALGASLNMDWTGQGIVIHGAVTLGEEGKIQ